MINHKGTVALATKRLLLRRFEIEDADQMYKNWAADDMVTKYLIWHTHSDVEETKSIINSWLEGYKSNKMYHWAIVYKEINEVIGSVTARTHEGSDLPELAYCIGREYWGQGVMSEALNKVSEYLFFEVGFQRIYGRHNVRNPAPIVLENLNMQYMGNVTDDSGTHKQYDLQRDIYMGENVLIFFEPIFLDKIWGGSKIRDTYGYTTPSDNIGEFWAISAVEGNESVIKNGKFKGQTLTWLFDEHRELFGGMDCDRFPLLIKIIDASSDLSIQVHPDDDYAFVNEDGSLGKTECWYILSAPENGKIVFGHNAKDRQDMADYIESGKWDELMKKVPVAEGDFFMVESGKVHALTSGVMCLEIQQASDVTYRIYDYGRLDDNGNERELHIDKALDVMQFPDKEYTYTQKTTVSQNAKITVLAETDKFKVTKYSITDSFSLENNNSFCIVCVTKGGGRCNNFYIKQGSFFLASSAVTELNFSGDMEFIKVHI